MLIFLDIDGVLVPAASWRSPQLLADGFPMFSLNATRALQSLLSSETTVILTSSRRDRFSNNEWMRIFEQREIAINKFGRLDSPYNFQNRKDELIDWFSSHAVDEDFVIIDDDTRFNSLPDRLKEYLVLTSPLIGLTFEHLDQIGGMLKA